MKNKTKDIDMPHTIALVGLGKIARSQHLPAIEANPAFRLTAAACLHGDLPGLPCCRDHRTLLAAAALDALAICTPPDARFAIALDALEAGKHVMLEKPPTTTPGGLATLARLAATRRVSLFTAWHSQHNAAVDSARAWLVGRVVTSLHIDWEEDVSKYHRGQAWIWRPGGFGVFDAASNGLSILTHILPAPLVVEAATLYVPTDAETPIAASVAFASRYGPMTASFDWRTKGAEKREITLATEDGHELQLLASGGRLLIDGEEISSHPRTEYPNLYARFASLIATGTSNVDAAPLQLIADIFLLARHHRTGPFNDPAEA